MREIKFRAWDGERMKPILLWGFNEGFIMTSKYSADEEEFKVMQYTGLKDKNGIEIYEGDILETTSELLTNLGKTRTGRFHTSYSKVIWKDDGWGYEVVENNGIGLVKGYQNKGLMNQPRYSKVIGNIYENPELLEGGQ